MRPGPREGGGGRIPSPPATGPEPEPRPTTGPAGHRTGAPDTPLGTKRNDPPPPEHAPGRRPGGQHPAKRAPWRAPTNPTGWPPPPPPRDQPTPREHRKQGEAPKGPTQKHGETRQRMPPLTRPPGRARPAASREEPPHTPDPRPHRQIHHGPASSQRPPHLRTRGIDPSPPPQQRGGRGEEEEQI